MNGYGESVRTDQGAAPARGTPVGAPLLRSDPSAVNCAPAMRIPEHPVGARFIAPELPPDTSALNSDIHHRRSIRLRGYDYSQAGAYFISLCTQKRECLFGAVAGNIMRLNDAGHMVQNIWEALPDLYAGVTLDTFVVMPNHIHGIIMLNDVGARFIAPNNDQGTENQGAMALHSHSTNPSKYDG